MATFSQENNRTKVMGEEITGKRINTLEDFEI